MRRSELVRALVRVPGFPHPAAELEQVITPPEAAATLLLEALSRGDLAGRSVVDLGAGTGRLAIGAALLGARPVTGIEISAEAVAIARRTATLLGVRTRFRVGDVSSLRSSAQTVLMNPPFGAQNRRADRPFWDAALDRPGRTVYAFALSDSRTFIEARAVERSAQIESTRPVPWELPATFAYHRRRVVDLPVDLWVIRTMPKDR